MADPYSAGGGGGRASSTTDNTQDALDQLYELVWPFSPQTAQQLNEMMLLLHRSSTKRYSDIQTINSTLSTGVGNVTGPASAVSGNIATFSGTTGKIIADSGSSVGSIGGSPVGGILKQSQVTITNAQMKSLNTTPVDVVAAPGAGFIAIPVMCWVHTSIPVTGYNTANSCSLRYTGIAVDIGNAQTLASTSAEDSYKYISIQGVNFNSANTNPANTAVTLRATGNLTGGDAANTFSTVVTYIVVATTIF